MAIFHHDESLNIHNCNQNNPRSLNTELPKSTLRCPGHFKKTLFKQYRENEPEFLSMVPFTQFADWKCAIHTARTMG